MLAEKFGYLRCETENYWKLIKDKPYRVKIETYLDKLLPLELEVIEGQKTDRQEDNHEVCNLLVMLVGLSYEPLLQSICIYKPQKVQLIFNEKYSDMSGEEYAGILMKAINAPEFLEIAQIKTIEIQPAYLKTEKANPAGVFQLLLSNLKNTIEGTIIDITGSKKNMVAGAFLYAALTGVDVSYVDFRDDWYDPDSRRPYGFGAQIEKLGNPYEFFSLRDWQRVRSSFNRGNFRQARELLGGIGEYIAKAHDQIGDLLTPGQCRAMEILSEVLRFYEKWDSGDFHGALEQAREMNIFDMESGPPSVGMLKLPAAVRFLGPFWPQVENDQDVNDAARWLFQEHQDLETGVDKPLFYAHPELVLVYVYDELARIKRMIVEEDYRSAFLRAHGIYEVLGMARIFGAWKHDQLEFETDLGELQEAEINELMMGFVKWPSSSAGQRETCLRWRPGKDKYVVMLRTGVGKDVRMHIKERISPLQKYWRSVAFTDTAKFSQLRNKAIHTYLYLPRHLAVAAIELMEASLEEYQNNWVKHNWGLEINVAPDQPLAWDTICDVVGIDFLPSKY
ncbi:hypothetical protein KQH40_01370 [bacterium]|nr:hypothetical protein [bacterium]